MNGPNYRQWRDEQTRTRRHITHCTILLSGVIFGGSGVVIANTDPLLGVISLGGALVLTWGLVVTQIDGPHQKAIEWVGDKLESVTKDTEEEYPYPEIVGEER